MAGVQLTEADYKLREAVDRGDLGAAAAQLRQPNPLIAPDIAASALRSTSFLHRASSNGDVGMVELLLDFGADPNKQSMLGKVTPLSAAVGARAVNPRGPRGTHRTPFAPRRGPLGPRSG